MRIVLVALSALLIAIPARAGVITFGFTGVVSDQVLQSGFYQDFGTSNPAWLGLGVSGTIRMDLDAAFLSYALPGEMQQYSKTQDHPSADWLSITMLNPDGTSLLIPSGMPPNPLPQDEGDDALTFLRHSSTDSGFYAQRSYTNGVSFPQQQFALSLRSVGAGSTPLTNGVDFYNALIDAGAANWDNYGFLRNDSAADQRYGYAFLVESVTLLPEPPGWSLVLGALGFLALTVRLRLSRLGRAPRLTSA